MSTTHLSGPLNLNSDANTQSDRLPFGTNVHNRSFGGSTIVDGVATTLLTITIPNVECSLLLKILARVGLTTSGHKYDSSRLIEQAFVITRRAGKAVVGQAATASATQIATVSGGTTFTATLALGSPSGGATATNTITLQITATGGGTDTFDCDLFYDLNLSEITSGVTVA